MWCLRIVRRRQWKHRLLGYDTVSLQTFSKIVAPSYSRVISPLIVSLPWKMKAALFFETSENTQRRGVTLQSVWNPVDVAVIASMWRRHLLKDEFWGFSKGGRSAVGWRAVMMIMDFAPWDQLMSSTYLKPFFTPYLCFWKSERK